MQQRICIYPFFSFFLSHFGLCVEMGNNQSDIKHPFGSRTIPKHLKPLKKKKKPKKPSSTYSSSRENLPAAAQPPPVPPLPILLLNTSSNGDDVQLAGEETDFVGSGPRGAFRWFKGRRYLNHAEEVRYLEDFSVAAS